LAWLSPEVNSRFVFRRVIEQFCELLRKKSASFGVPDDVPTFSNNFRCLVGST
jgi:hypothetical protein